MPITDTTSGIASEPRKRRRYRPMVRPVEGNHGASLLKGDARLFRCEEMAPAESGGQGPDECLFLGQEGSNLHMAPIRLIQAERLLAADRAGRIAVPGEAGQFRIASWNNGVGAVHGWIITGTAFGGKLPAIGVDRPPGRVMTAGQGLYDSVRETSST